VATWSTGAHVDALWVPRGQRLGREERLTAGLVVRHGDVTMGSAAGVGIPGAGYRRPAIEPTPAARPIVGRMSAPNRSREVSIMRALKSGTTVAATLALVLSAAISPAMAQSEASPKPAGSALEGVRWRLVSLGPAPSAMEQTARFERGGGLAISTGCASHTGTYSVDGASLLVDALRRDFGSLVECDFGEQGSADTFRNVVESARGWSIDEEGLLIIVGSGDYEGWTLTFEPGGPAEVDDGDPSALEPAAIAGDWRLETMDLGPAGVATLPEDVEFSLTVAPDGALSGSGSCSEYEGTFAIVGGQRITISDISAAEASDCEDELADLQRLYLAILPVTDGIRLEDGALILIAAAISAELVFEPAA
jgi:heat shock protein HslJ